jgi:hypothetical protein
MKRTAKKTREQLIAERDAANEAHASTCRKHFAAMGLVFGVDHCTAFSADAMAEMTATHAAMCKAELAAARAK